MKKLVYVTFITLLSILGISSVKAGSVSISCNSTNLKVNESTTCYVTGSSSDEVTALSASYYASGNISITSATAASGWQGDGSGGSFDLYTDVNKTGSFSIGTIVIKASSTSGSGTVGIGSAIFTIAPAFSEVGAGSTSVNITVYEPTPDPTPTPNPTPIPTPNPPKQETTPSNTNNNENKKSNDATLKELVISNAKINFSRDVESYDVKVSNEVDKIEIKATPTNSKATVAIPKDSSLKVGKNTFEIVVTAEDKTTKTYKINITRLERELSKDSSLKTIEIEGYKIDFKKDEYSYNIGNISTNKLKITAIANDENAKVVIYGNEDIKEQDVIVIKVTAEDKSESEYILYVNNTSKDKSTKTNIELIIIVVLFIISAFINVLLAIKSLKKKKQNKII